MRKNDVSKSALCATKTASAPQNAKKRCQRFRLFRGILYHLVGDAGQLRDLFGDRPLGVDERVESGR